MPTLTVPNDQAAAIASVIPRELTHAIDIAIREESTAALRPLNLECCGIYVAQKMSGFEKAIAAHRKAKSPRKREKTEYDLRRSGYALTHAVDAMQQRVNEERTDAKRFIINDQVLAPSRFNESLSVAISYRWRQAAQDSWRYSRITFTHKAKLHEAYLAPAPKRKPSAAKQEQERQERLYREWEHLLRGALDSLRDFFRNGGDGAKIPETFEAVADPRDGSLNNHSTKFWLKPPQGWTLK
jgi:hypothetical protein